MTFGEIIKQRWKPYYSYFHDFSDFITCIFVRIFTHILILISRSLLIYYYDLNKG